MALINLARRIRLHPLLPSLLLHSPPYSASPTSTINYFSSSATPPPPKTHLHTLHLSSLHLSPHRETSDFESDSDEPTTPFNESGLPGFLQLISHAKSQFSSQEEALAFLRSSSGIRPNEGLVCLALWELRGDWESALLAFRWAGECVSDCRRAWHLMIWVLGKQGRFDLAWSLVRRMYRRSILTRRSLLIMMERYAAANEAGKAIKTFHAMEKFKINADSTTFYGLLCALCKNRYVEEAEELLFLKRKFFPLEAESFNIILDGWCNIIVDVIEAKRFWREMSNCCITPNGTSYTHMICCFSKVGNLYDSLRFYDGMKKRGWIPDLDIYNSLIYVLTRENCLKEAHNIFDKILEAGLRPDVRTYNSIMYPLCEAHKLEEAHEVLDEMIEKGINPTIETYNALSNAENLEGTLKLLKRMRDVGCGPDRHTFLLIFRKFFRFGESVNALRMWNEMRRYCIAPDSSHYIALVQGLAMHGWIPKAREFCNEMRSKGFTADPKLDKMLSASVSSARNHKGRVGKGYILAQREMCNTPVGVKIR